MLHATFGLTFPKQWGFENWTPSSGMLSATTNATNSAEIGSELPKTAKICQNQPKDETLKFQQESRSEWFSKINICKCRRDIGACLHRSDLQSYNFSYVFFFTGSGLCVWISAYSFGKKKFILQPSTTLMNMRFCTHVCNSPKNKNLNSERSYLCPKMVFGHSKHCCTPRAQWEKTFS
jgi:hypothetical protein